MCRRTKGAAPRGRSRTAGEPTAGEATAGERTAGERTAGEATAGEATSDLRVAGGEVKELRGEWGSAKWRNGAGKLRPTGLTADDRPVHCPSSRTRDFIREGGMERRSPDRHRGAQGSETPIAIPRMALRTRSAGLQAGIVPRRFAGGRDEPQTAGWLPSRRIPKRHGDAQARERRPLVGTAARSAAGETNLKQRDGPYCNAYFSRSGGAGAGHPAGRQYVVRPPPAGGADRRSAFPEPSPRFCSGGYASLAGLRPAMPVGGPHRENWPALHVPVILRGW